MKTKNIIIYIVVCLIVIAGLAVWNAKGFNLELQFSARKQIQLSNYTGIKTSDIENICSEVLGNTKYFIQRVETFGNAVSIVAKDITEEQKEQIINKFNEKYETNIEKDTIEIKSIAATRVRDIIKKYILPGIAITIGIIIYFLIRYRKIGIKPVLLKSIALPIVTELIMFSIMSIARIPFGRLAIALASGLFLICIFVLTNIFENQNDKIIEELEKESK